MRRLETTLRVAPRLAARALFVSAVLIALLNTSRAEAGAGLQSPALLRALSGVGARPVADITGVSLALRHVRSRVAPKPSCFPDSKDVDLLASH